MILQITTEQRIAYGWNFKPKVNSNENAFLPIEKLIARRGCVRIRYDTAIFILNVCVHTHKHIMHACTHTHTPVHIHTNIWKGANILLF